MSDLFCFSLCKLFGETAAIDCHGVFCAIAVRDCCERVLSVALLYKIDSRLQRAIVLTHVVHVLKYFRTNIDLEDCNQRLWIDVACNFFVQGLDGFKFGLETHSAQRICFERLI